MEETLTFPCGGFEVVSIHPLVFSRIMDTLLVSGWQVQQEADGLHVLLGGVRGALDEEVLANTVRRAFAEQGAIIPHVQVQQVTSIKKNASGKASLIKSNLLNP